MPISRTEWKTFRCSNGYTTQYRKHFGAVHWDQWARLCKKRGIGMVGGWKRKLAEEEARAEPFSMEGFQRRLMDWMVDDKNASTLRYANFITC